MSDDRKTQIEDDEISDEEIESFCRRIALSTDTKQQQRFYEFMQDIYNDPDYQEWQQERSKGDKA